MMAEIMKYFKTDTLWYYFILAILNTDYHCSFSYFDVHERIYKEQQRVWVPILENLEENFGFMVKTTRDFSALDQPSATVDFMKHHLQLQDQFSLSGTSILEISYSKLLIRI